MKKYIAVILVAVGVLMCLSACGKNNSANNSQREKIQIVTTIFPEYDWVKEILGDNFAQAEVTMLLDNRVDLHSYQPTVEDIMKILESDLFIYVGGESDEWVEDILKEADNRNVKVINLSDVLGDMVKTEEAVEGMQEHEHEEHDHEEHDHEEERDEHVWLSLKNAKVFCEAISGALQEIDPDNKDTYIANASAYIDKLTALDSEYQNVVADAAKQTVLFCDRFPFRYLVDDYGLEYYAAFSGCSAETEAGFETIAFLAKKVDELDLQAVLTLEKSDGKIAKTVIENTKEKNQTVLQMDSMQSLTLSDAETGTNYLSVMERNLSVLKQALQ